MNRSVDKTIIEPETGLGDVFYSTAVINSVHRALPDINLYAMVSQVQGTLLQGSLKRNGGPLEDLVGKDYYPTCSEILVTTKGYLDRNQSLNGTNYVASQIAMIEEQLREFFPAVDLERKTEMEVSFDNVPEYGNDIVEGKKKVTRMLDEHGDKPIIWLGTTTVGSANRMPQSYGPKRNFWSDLIDASEDKFIFYELRGPSDSPIDERVEPVSGENYSFAAQSEIIKSSNAGIGLDGMQRAFADALRKKKMVVLVGPTHPRAIVMPGEEERVLTIPGLEDYDGLNHCRGCSMVGYPSQERLRSSFDERKEKMRERFSPDFEFDPETQRVIDDENLDALKSTPLCRKLLPEEHFYDCWANTSVEETLEKLDRLVRD